MPQDRRASVGVHLPWISAPFVVLCLFLSACWDDAPNVSTQDGSDGVGEDGGGDEGDDAASSVQNGEGDGGGPTGTGALCGLNGQNDCGAYQVCDAVLGCVECAADVDCPLSSRHCIAGRCAPCQSEPDDAGATGCPASAPSCWPADHTCHAACAGDSDCPADTPSCDLASGQCRGCTDDAGCAGGVCSRATRTCVQCAGDGDCGGAVPRCDVARGLCVQCSSNVDCGRAAPVCDPSTLTCRAGCLRDAQCPGGHCDTTRDTCVSDAGDDQTDGGDSADTASGAGGGD